MRRRSGRRNGGGGGVPGWLVIALGTAFGLGVILSGVLVFSAIRDLTSRLTTGAGLPTFSARVDPESEPEGEAGIPTPIPLRETPEPWNGTDRVNVLVMGLDFRDWLAGEGPPRTDSMMLLTVDPVAETAGMLSIPRDLWTEIPGFEHNRINTAFFLGETYNLPGGGPGLAMRTVENLLGVPVQYYAVIEFSAFERAIDEIGGVDVWVEEDIKISPIGEQSRWLRGNRGHHLDGPDALAYARARKSEGGDFDRAERQQEVAMAILDRVIGFEMVPLILRNAPKLYGEIAAGINTNLTLDQMIRLGLLVVQIPKSEMSRGVIAPPEMILFETLPDGAQVLKPVPDEIRVLRDEIFTTTGAIGPSISVEDPTEAAKAENASVAVLNGSGVEGLASNTTTFFSGLGINVTKTDNADRLDYAKTLLIDYTGNPYTARYLMELMGLSESQILSQMDPNSEVDIAVILGSDWFLP